MWSRVWIEGVVVMGQGNLAASPRAMDDRHSRGE